MNLSLHDIPLQSSTYYNYSIAQHEKLFYQLCHVSLNLVSNELEEIRGSIQSDGLTSSPTDYLHIRNGFPCQLIAPRLPHFLHIPVH